MLDKSIRDNEDALESSGNRGSGCAGLHGGLLAGVVWGSDEQGGSFLLVNDDFFGSGGQRKRRS